MEITFTFNHDAPTTNEAHVINGKTLQSILSECSKEKKNKLMDTITEFFEKNQTATDKVVCDYLVKEFSNDFNILVIAGMYAGVAMYTVFPTIQAQIAINTLTTDYPKISMHIEKVMKMTEQKMLDKGLITSNEQMLSAKMIIVGIYYAFLEEMKEDDHPSSEKCSKCEAETCPIRVSKYVDPLLN